MSDTEESAVKAPNYSSRIDFRKKQLLVRVLLHRIPEKLINFEPTPTHFHLDTLRYTKKLELHFPYPEGISVDINKAEAIVDRGVLTATVPISNVEQSAFEEGLQREKKIAASKLSQSQLRKRLRQAEKKKDDPEGFKSKVKKTDKAGRKSKAGKGDKGVASKRKSTDGSDETTKSLLIADTIAQSIEEAAKAKLEQESAKHEQIKSLEDKRIQRSQERMEKKKKILGKPSKADDDAPAPASKKQSKKRVSFSSDMPSIKKKIGKRPKLKK